MNPCIGCGAPARAKWCTAACHAKSRRTGAERACQGCAAIFYPRPREVRKGGGKYCSTDCRRAHEAARSTDYARIGGERAHRVIASRMLGRSLAPGEVVHHKDGHKRNNDASNLEVHASHSEHMREHVAAGGWGIRTHEQAVALGQRSGAARRAKRPAQQSSPHCLDATRQRSLFDAEAP